jgi:hypothetical protein
MKVVKLKQWFSPIIQKCAQAENASEQMLDYVVYCIDCNKIRDSPLYALKDLHSRIEALDTIPMDDHEEILELLDYIIKRLE